MHMVFLVERVLQQLKVKNQVGILSNRPVNSRAIGARKKITGTPTA